MKIKIKLKDKEKQLTKSYETLDDSFLISHDNQKLKGWIEESTKEFKSGRIPLDPESISVSVAYDW